MTVYNLYIGAGKVVGFTVLVLLLLELFFADGVIVFVGLISLGVGFYELVAGLSLLLSKRKRPAWFDRHIRYYWMATLLYFAILYVLVQADVAESLIMVWLFIVPWAIAVYQYVIVYQLRNQLVVQKEKERWQEEQNQKILTSSFKEY